MTEDRKKLFGKRIKELRKARNLTQEKLSEKMDISTNYLSSTERGTENPTFDMLMKYSDALDVEMSELLDFQHQAGSRELKAELNNLLKEVDNENLRLITRLIKTVVR